MLELRDGLTTLTVDVEATRHLYALRNAGENCKCHGCGWFAAHHEEAYPPSFRVLLESLGIDVSLPNEVVTYADDIPNQVLPVYVDGTFDFVGSFQQTEKINADLPLASLPGGFRYRFLNGWGQPRQRGMPANFSPISHVAFEWLPGAA